MTRTILVVDDEAALRRVLTRLFQSAGYTVLPAGSGEEAVELLKLHEVDLVLMDLRMPGMSGRTLYHVIASQWPHLATRIVVMSGDPDDDDHRDWLALHDLPIATKPFELAQLLDLVQRMTADERRRVNGQ